MAASDERHRLFSASGFHQLTIPAREVLASQLQAFPACLLRVKDRCIPHAVFVSSDTPSLQTTGISLSRPQCFWKISCYLTAKLNQSSRESQLYCSEAISDSQCAKQERVASRRNVHAHTYHTVHRGSEAPMQYRAVNAPCFPTILCCSCWTCLSPECLVVFGHTALNYTMCFIFNEAFPWDSVNIN